jgi:ribosomal protein S18 acetylase RimI-like enzyme
MDIGHLTVETDPTDADVRFLEDRLYEYNVQQTGVDDGQWLALFLRDDHGTIQAGCKGWTWCGSCYIQTVWVHPDLRGQDVGTHLLQAAEQEARARGCRQIVLGSFSFQAPGFYQKLGFEVVAVLEDHPRGHRQYYLRKRLT